MENNYNIYGFKFGTNIIANGNGVNDTLVESIVEQCMEIRRADERNRVFVVCSGAVKLGREEYGKEKRNDETPREKKKYSTAGQALLEEIFRRHLRRHKSVCNQFLISKQDFGCSKGRIGIQDTLDEIFSDTATGTPIINENDAVDDDELLPVDESHPFTDNDGLFMQLAKLLKMKEGIIASNVHGVQQDKDDPHTVIPHIHPDQEELYRGFVDEKPCADGLGGMISKFNAGIELARNGIDTHVACGTEENVLTRIILNRERVGTLFSKQER